MAISKVDVMRAVNALNKEGAKPSSLNVHKHLGEGSLTTITKYLKEYTAEMEAEIELEARSQVFRPETIFADQAKMFRMLERRIKALEKEVKHLKGDQ